MINNLFYWKAVDREIRKEINQKVILGKKAALTDEELVKKVSAEKLNQVIDKIMDNGVIVERYLRRCLKCEELFIARGKFKRRCTSCKKEDHRWK